MPFTTSPPEEPNPARQSYPCSAVEQKISKVPVVGQKMGKHHADHDGITSLPIRSTLIVVRPEQPP